LYQAQTAILSDNLVGKLVYGDESVDGDMVFSMDENECAGIDATTDNAGDYIALMAFRPFFQLSEEKNISDFEDIKEEYCKASVKGDKASVKNLLANNKVYSAPHGWSAEKFYVVDYTIFLSTIVGVILALVFLSFCFDVATRTIKLQFLELLAPIPIISYIDPDKSKNGMFSKWLKEVFTTWLSLFMRLLAFHIAIYLISVLKDVQLEGESLWINLLIIIGVLMFAKELPKLLENIMGIKMSGSFNLNPLKKIGDNALGGKLLTGAAVAGAGLAASGLAQSASNMYAFGRDKWNLHKAIMNEEDGKKREKLQRQYDSMHAGRFLATASGGLVGGARHGAVSGYKTGQKGSANVFGNLRSDLKTGNTTRNNRTAIRNFNRELKATATPAEYKEQKYGWFERNVTENVDNLAGVKNEYGGYGFYDKKVSELKRKIENNQQQEEALRTAAANVCANNGWNFVDLYDQYGKGTIDTTKYGQLLNTFEAIKKLDDDTKSKRAEMKGFQEMIDTRENLKKDK